MTLVLDSGAMALDGEPYSPRSINDAMASGIGYVPENRLIDAAFPDLSVAENITASVSRSQGWPGRAVPPHRSTTGRPWSSTENEPPPRPRSGASFTKASATGS